MADSITHRPSLRRLDEVPGIQIASLVARLVLGVVMLIAGAEKITAMDLFAANIYAYKILPLSLVNIAALAMVWTEITVGVLLIVGAAVRGAALVSGLLLLLFIAAIGSAMARGLDIDCGCFQGRPAPGQSAVSATPPAPLPPVADPRRAADTLASPDSVAAATADSGGETVGWPKLFEDIGLLALAVFLVWYPKSWLTADRSLRLEGAEDATPS